MLPSQDSPAQALLPWPARLAIFAAAALPSLIAFNRPPSLHMMRELAAFFLWGLAVAAVGVVAAGVRVPWRALRPLHLLLVVLGAGVLVTWIVLQTVAGPKLSALAFLGSAALVACAGGMAARSKQAHGWLIWLFAGWLFAGLVNSGIGVLQVYVPDWTGNHLVAAARTPGRAVGNIYQPNSLATNLLWAMVGLVGLMVMKRLRVAWGCAAMLLLCLGLALSGSRMGLVGLLGLAVWGWAAHSLGRPARALLVAAPLVYGLAQLVLTQLQSPVVIQAGVSHILRGGDVTSSRLGVWQQAFEIAAQRPLTGVGFGEFNTAWTLTPFATRHPRPWDHAHNLFVHWIVEFGWPLAAVLGGLVVWAAIAAWRNLRRQGNTQRALSGCLLAAVGLVGLHSQVEFPLWYPFFLLPIAFAWGYLLSILPRETNSQPAAAARFRPVLLAGVVLSTATVLAFGDFLRAFQLAYAVDRRLPLPASVASARSTVLFSAYVDWIEATELDATTAVSLRARQFIIDRKLLAAWARAAAREGRAEHSQYLLQRLREFCTADPGLQPVACESVRAEAVDAPSLPGSAAVFDWRRLR